jgi:MraZ protein
MRNFIGCAEAAVDSKGRLALPQRFRRLLLPDDNETFVVGRGLDGELWAFPILVWRDLSTRLQAIHPMNPFSPNQRNYHRRFTQESEECRLDPQGRLVLPAKLREKAKINGRAIVAGSFDWLEIWDPKAYAEFRDKNDGAAERSAGEIDLAPRPGPAEG